VKDRIGRRTVEKKNEGAKRSNNEHNKRRNLNVQTGKENGNRRGQTVHVRKPSGYKWNWRRKETETPPQDEKGGFGA